MKRRLVFLVCAVLGVPGQLPGANSKSPPNIVVILVDDYGWLEAGYQGKYHATPHIDALAASGMQFSRAYAASPTCSPSRAGLLTGRHPAALGIVRHLSANPQRREFSVDAGDPAGMPSRNGLPAGAKTYGAAMRELGYYTAFHGKWHLGDGDRFPTGFGFDEQVGTTNRGSPANFLAPFWPETVYADAPRGSYLTDRQAEDAVHFIRKNAGRRFLLSLFFYAVHTPKIGRPDYVAEAKARGLTGQLAEYDAMVRVVDDSVGRIVAALDAAEISDNTVLIFTSDQGSFFERPPMRGSKKAGTALFEGGARVPFIASWPGRIAAGSRCEQPISLTDVFPTLVELAGGDPAAHAGLDGASLVPVLLGKGRSRHEPLILYRSYDNQYAAVVEGRWKLIAHRDGHHELYDVIEDVSEKHDRATAEPEVTRRLGAKLAAWEDSLGIRLAPGAKFPAGFEPGGWK